MESAGILSSPRQHKLEQHHHDADDDEIRVLDAAADDEADDGNTDYNIQLRAHVAELRVREAEQEARDAELRAREAEQRAQEAEQRAEEAEKNAAHEKKLRANYYNQQCRLKKEWDRQKVHLRLEISSLKGKIWDLRNEEQKVIKALREEILQQNEQIESLEKDLNLFEAMVAERDRTIQQNESDYRALLDDLINAKITIEELKSAI